MVHGDLLSNVKFLPKSTLREIGQLLARLHSQGRDAISASSSQQVYHTITFIQKNLRSNRWFVFSQDVDLSSFCHGLLCGRQDVDTARATFEVMLLEGALPRPVQRLFEAAWTRVDRGTACMPVVVRDF